MFTLSLTPGIKGIVFDAVGTLIHPVPSVSAAYADAARRQGVILDPEEVKRRFRLHFGTDERDDLSGPLATDEPAEYRRWRRIVKNTLPEVPDMDRAFDELWAHFAHPASWRTFPHVAPALRKLESEPLALGIASNFDGRLRGVLAGLNELGPLRDTLVISSEVGYRKPHPAFYLAVARRLGLEPAAVLHVGDDEENDIRGPRRVGMTAVIIDREGNGCADCAAFSGLDALVTSLCGSRQDAPHG